MILIFLVTLLLAHQIPFQLENELFHLNNFYSFTTQDHHDYNIKDSRFISNTAYMASIPKGTLLYHLTRVDPSFNDNEWENKTALWFCLVPEHCLSYSYIFPQKLITYQVIEDIDQLIYFSGNDAWMSSFSPMQAFVEGEISDISFYDHKKFCHLNMKPTGWVTTNSWFEVVLCNRGFPTYLKFIDSKTIQVPEKMNLGFGTMDSRLLYAFDINRYVNIYYSTLTILNSNYFLNRTMPSKSPGRTATKEDIVSFQKKTKDLMLSDCWQEFKDFHSFEMKARSSLKYWTHQLFFVMEKLTANSPYDSKLSAFIQNQACLHSLLITLPLNQLEGLLLSYPTANNRCGQQLEVNLKSVYQSTKYYLSYLKKELEELVYLNYDSPDFDLEKTWYIIQQKSRHIKY